jgi:putative transposase
VTPPILDKEVPMPRSRFTEEKIVKILQESEAGAKTEELCRRHGIARQTFYSWRKKYGGMELSDVKRLKELEEENRRLKKAVADLTLDKQILQEWLSKKV